jgi:hypothetical protein
MLRRNKDLDKEYIKRLFNISKNNIFDNENSFDAIVKYYYFIIKIINIL